MNSETVFFPLLLTTKTCAVSLFLFLFLAVPLSYWLAGRKSIFAKAVELLITLPLVFPPIALGYMLLVVLGRNGLVGILLENLGLRMVFSQTRQLFSLHSLPVSLLSSNLCRPPLTVRKQRN